MSRTDFLAHLATQGPDDWDKKNPDRADSPSHWYDITPSDADYLSIVPDRIYVSNAGDVVLEDIEENTITLTVADDTTINLSPVKVKSTGTTATGIKGLYRPAGGVSSGPVFQAGGGDSVSITGPLGQKAMASSVSVVIASDQTDLSIDDGGNSITIDGSVSITGSLPAGTNNIGDVDIASALPAGDNNIGNVDVVTLPSLPAGTNNIGDVDVASLPAGTVSAATAKTADLDTGAGTDTVVIAGIALPASGGAVVGGTSTDPIRTDPTGTTAQPITDNGGSLTIDGSVSLTGSLPAGTNNIGNVDVVTLPSLPAGTNNIGDVDIASALPAGSNNIGDVDIASALPAGSNSIGAVKDDGPQWTSVFGVSGAAFTSADATTAAAVTDAPTATEKLVITDVVISVDTAMSVELQEETSATVIAKFYMAANSTVQWTVRSKTKLATADKKLMAKASVAGNIAVTAHYYSEA